MNLKRLEESVRSLAVHINSSDAQHLHNSLQNLELFARYAPQDSGNQKAISDYILTRAKEIETHYDSGDTIQAASALSKLEGFVDGIKNVEHPTLVYIPSQNLVKIGDDHIYLNDGEADLLNFFYENADVIHNREAINQGAWDGRKSNRSTFVATMNNLISKIQPDINSLWSR